ncbi:MAG: PD-(D/E)XK nuclease family protein [Clostridia bacterium]|nr:PD-(D/E)XK nuclease family protein [Clostridia bacterium]
MLKIFYGRENVNKEKFLYEHIEKPAIVLVPDQYTLEAEAQALRYLGTKSLMDVEIMSISRLGDRVLEKVGGGRKTFLDKYGRHILLSKILREEGDKLKTFNKVKDKTNFIEEVNNFISQAKQYDIDLDGLDSPKAQDLNVIMKAYEKAIKGKYTDSEDRIDLYLERMKDYADLKDTNIYVYGFDSFAPKTIKVIKELERISPCVNVIMTWDDTGWDVFRLTGHVMDILGGERIRIEGYQKEYKNGAIAHVEENIYAMPYRKYKGDGKVTFLQCANPYNEAETLASYILKFVRDEGLRYRDILVVSNSQNQEIIERVLSEYGISVFIDKKRSIASSGIIMAITNLLKGDVIGFLKSGFSCLDSEEVEELDNYGYTYKIKKNMWLKPFKYGDISVAEPLRKKAVEPFVEMQKIQKESKTNREFGVKLDELLGKMGFSDKIEELAVYQEEKLGQMGQDMAQETRQIYSGFVTVIEQIALLLGDEAFRIEEYMKLFEAGINGFKVGVLPPTIDGVTLGTTQRSRTSDVRACIVLSANEGVLPMTPPETALLTKEELGQYGELGSLDAVKMDEEKLAIYRTFSKPTEYLIVSTLTSDTTGEALRISPVMTKVMNLLDKPEVLPDVLNREGDSADLDLLGGRVNTLRQITNNLQQATADGQVGDVFRQALYMYRDSREAKLIKDGIGFTNERERIDARKAFGEEITLSPSRLEKYARCPFMHFIQYGIKVDERRQMELDFRNIGNIYHDVFMKAIEKLKADNTIHTITRQELDDLVEELAHQLFDYDFEMGKREDYQKGRIVNICKDNVWALVSHIRDGQIEDIMLESAFEPGAEIDPITITLDDGQKVNIQGRIDRVDILPGNKVKIIDYKSGKESFKAIEAEKGYRLQLMLYLKAAQGKDKIPAGVFYFLIKEPIVKKGEDPEGAFKMDGIFVNEESTIQALDSSMEGTSKIIHCQRKKDGGYTRATYLTREEFTALQEKFDNKIQEFCQNLVNGDIKLRPMKTKKKTVCANCKYKGICRFDTAFEGCSYEIIE